jgi:HEAT repeat protein
MSRGCPRLLALALALVVLGPGMLPAQRVAPSGGKSGDLPDKKEPPATVMGKTVRDWIVELYNKDPSIKRDAIQALPFFGQYSAEAVPMLVYIIESDPDVTLQINAAIVLMHVEVKNKDAPAAVKALVKQLMLSNQLTLRYHCIVTLGRFEELAESAIPYLQRAAADTSSWELRQAACHALFRIGGKMSKKAADPRVVASLIVALGDPASKVREEAVMGLALIGRIENQDLRSKYLKALRLCVTDRDKAVVVWSYFGLMLNEGSSADYLREIARYIQTGDVPTKMHALRALGLLKREAKTKLPDIIAALKDQDPYVIATAMTVLAQMSDGDHAVDPGQAAIDKIQEIIDDKKTLPGLKELAKSCLDRITGKDKEKEKEKAAKKDEK